jgi:hypothetical protein
MSLDLLRDTRGLIYVGSPYTLYRDGRHLAYIRVCLITKRMRAAGLHVLSPIECSHPIADRTGIDPLSPLWMKINRLYMEEASVFVIAKMTGWSASRGIAEEYAFFAIARKPIFHLDPETMRVEKRGQFLAPSQLAGAIE